MPDWKQQADKAADKYGIPRALFRSLIKHESGWRPQISSPAGAIGLTQLMPATAKGLGVDPYNPAQNLEGGARYLSQQKAKFGSWKLALAAYNAGPGAVGKYGGVPPFDETQRYVRNVLAGGTGEPASTPAAQPPPVSVGGASLPALPDLASVAMGNLSAISTGTYEPQEALGALTAAVGQSAPTTPAAPLGPGPAPSPTKADPSEWVNVPPRKGQWPAPGPQVLGFVAGVAKGYGQPLAVWDTSTHSRMTVNGNVSAHTDARAVDVPATGAKLNQLGYLALRRAGMGHAAAKKASQKGGLFNIGPWQIIFNTQVGGDHTDHLHVGYSPR